eukprot:731057-Pleurochrysis_carterae.AAC.3
MTVAVMTSAVKASVGSVRFHTPNHRRLKSNSGGAKGQAVTIDRRGRRGTNRDGGRRSGGSGGMRRPLRGCIGREDTGPLACLSSMMLLQSATACDVSMGSEARGQEKSEGGRLPEIRCGSAG